MAKVLSYHDSLLTKDDLKLLEKNNWLNDKIIGFCFEYFENDQFKVWSDSVAFVSPEVSQFLKVAPDDDISVFLVPLNLKQKSVVFFAVNNNEDLDHIGGSHWSLLCFRRDKLEMQHYDSSSAANAKHAEALSKKVSKYLCESGQKPKYTEVTTPQQNNCCDCGVYVICIVEQMCSSKFIDNHLNLDTVITPSYVTSYRKKIHHLIVNLSKEKKHDSKKS